MAFGALAASSVLRVFAPGIDFGPLLSRRYPAGIIATDLGAFGQHFCRLDAPAASARHLIA